MSGKSKVEPLKVRLSEYVGVVQGISLGLPLQPYKQYLVNSDNSIPASIYYSFTSTAVFPQSSPSLAL